MLPSDADDDGDGDGDGDGAEAATAPQLRRHKGRRERRHYGQKLTHRHRLMDAEVRNPESNPFLDEDTDSEVAPTMVGNPITRVITGSGNYR